MLELKLIYVISSITSYFIEAVYKEETNLLCHLLWIYILIKDSN